VPNICLKLLVWTLFAAAHDMKSGIEQTRVISVILSLHVPCTNRIAFPHSYGEASVFSIWFWFNFYFCLFFTHHYNYDKIKETKNKGK